MKQYAEELKIHILPVDDGQNTQAYYVTFFFLKADLNVLMRNGLQDILLTKNTWHKPVFVMQSLYRSFRNSIYMQVCAYIIFLNR